jgi:hypothetical protein
VTSSTSCAIFSGRELLLSISINITSAEAVVLQNFSQIINLLQTNKQFVITTIYQSVYRLPAFNAIKFLGFDDVIRTVAEGVVT